MRPWRQLGEADDVDIVSPSGQVRSRVKAYYAGSIFIIDDMTVEIEAGDELRRTLPNGKEDVFLVDDPKFFRSGHFGSHYQVAISRRGAFAAKTGGHYTVRVSGSNSRVNIGSTDDSTNLALNSDLFAEIGTTIRQQVGDPTHQALLLASLASMQQAETKSGYLDAYQKFIAAAANHMSLLAPFLPAIAQMIDRFSR